MLPQLHCLQQPDLQTASDPVTSLSANLKSVITIVVVLVLRAGKSMHTL